MGNYKGPATLTDGTHTVDLTVNLNSHRRANGMTDWGGTASIDMTQLAAVDKIRNASIAIQLPNGADGQVLITNVDVTADHNGPRASVALTGNSAPPFD